MDLELIKQRQQESQARREARIHNQKILQEELLKPYVLTAPDLGTRANELQFYHDIHGGRTYAVLPPDADELRTVAMKLLGGGSELAVNIRMGIAIVNKAAGDTYNRSVGRTVATGKINTVAMKLESVSLVEGYQRFVLRLGDLQIGLSLEKKSSPKFLFAYKNIG